MLRTDLKLGLVGLMGLYSDQLLVWVQCVLVWFPSTKEFCSKDTGLTYYNAFASEVKIRYSILSNPENVIMC